MDLRFFPYDQQECRLVFGSWHHHTGVVNLTDSSYANLHHYDPSPDFKLIKMTAERHSVKYACCPEEYVDVTYSFHLKRESGAYSAKLVLPAVITGFMVLATFLLPPASHEKITLCGLLFMCLLLQLIYLHDIVPASGETMLADFLVFALFIDGFATVLAVISYHVYIRSSPQMEPQSSIIKNEGDDYDLKIKLPIDVSKL